MSSLDLTSMILGNQVQAFKEVWKVIPGYPGDPYRVSISGRVQTRLVKIGFNKWVIGNESDWRDLRLDLSIRGYMAIVLSSSGKKRKYLVHQLILQTFVGPCPSGEEGCHWDGKPPNNHLCNLRWDAHAANLADRIRHGTDLRGERGPNVFITQEYADMIRVEYAAGGCTHKELAKKYGLSYGYISKIVNRKVWDQ